MYSNQAPPNTNLHVNAPTAFKMFPYNTLMLRGLLLSGKKEEKSLYRPWGFQDIETPRFQENRHMEVVRLQPHAPAAFTPRSWY